MHHATAATIRACTDRRPDAAPALRTEHGRVARSGRVAPNLLEITVSGIDVSRLVGGDEFVYALVSDDEGGIDPGYDMDDHRRRSAGDAVRGAYYTVRRSRSELGEVDLWVVDHDHPGSVASWMRTATIGDRIALWGPRRGFVTPPDVRHLLLVADETGFAAVAALIDLLPPDRRATAILECIGAGHRPPMPEHPRLDLVWVDRGADAPATTNRLLEAVATTAPAGIDAAFGAGEATHLAAIRRHLHRVHGLPSARTSVTGYWRSELG